MAKDGGQAFPIPGRGGDSWPPERGMSLRDYFAAAALPGLIGQWSPSSNASIAAFAYKLADAMLAEQGEVGVKTNTAAYRVAPARGQGHQIHGGTHGNETL